MNWNRTVSGRLPARRSLRVERLEDRSLLAVAAFEVNLYADEGGVPGESISSDTVSVGDNFFVEITAREFDPYFAGLGAIALDVAWDPNVFAEIDANLAATITSNLPLFQGGDLDQSAGTIDNLRGAAFLSSGTGRAIGNLFPERFALLHFRAIGSAAASPLELREGRSGIGTVPVSAISDADIRYEQQRITVKSPVAPPELLPPEDVAPPNSHTEETAEVPVGEEIDVATTNPAPPIEVADFSPPSPSEGLNPFKAEAEPSGPKVDVGHDEASKSVPNELVTVSPVSAPLEVTAPVPHSSGHNPCAPVTVRTAATVSLQTEVAATHRQASGTPDWYVKQLHAIDEVFASPSLAEFVASRPELEFMIEMSLGEFDVGQKRSSRS